MSTDETALMVKRYRASVEDEPTPALDQVLIAAAGREVSRRRFVRRTGGAAFATAVLLLGGTAVWHVRHSNLDRTAATTTVTGYGSIEGITRPYLLQAGMAQSSGPGINEGAQ